jgi:ABC-type Fe3+ transport system permease subunit
VVVAVACGVLPPLAALLIASVVLKRGDCFADPLTTFTVVGDLILLVLLCYLAAAVGSAIALAPRRSRFAPRARVAIALLVTVVVVTAIGFGYAGQRGGPKDLPCDRVTAGEGR